MKLQPPRLICCLTASSPWQGSKDPSTTDRKQALVRHYGDKSGATCKPKNMRIAVPICQTCPGLNPILSPSDREPAPNPSHIPGPKRSEVPSLPLLLPLNLLTQQPTPRLSQKQVRHEHQLNLFSGFVFPGELFLEANHQPSI